MEFPGLLGVGLHRLRMWIQAAPYAALGPFMGIIAADIAVDMSRGRLTSVGIEVVIAPLMALVIRFVAQRPDAGISGILMLVLGAVSALGSASMLSLAVGYGSAPLLIIGLRHLTVAGYAWASIASEPPPRRRVALQPVRF